MSEEAIDHGMDVDQVDTGSQPSGDLRSDEAIPLDDPRLYINRETSWLDFNERVLEEACDSRHPLLERLKFLAIYGTNLDELFMIRVAGLKQQIDAEIHWRSDDGLQPEEQLGAVSEKLRPSLARVAEVLAGSLLPALQEHGIRVFGFDELDDHARAALRRYFDERVFPVLTPLAIDAGHPFPYISNLSISLAFELQEHTPDGPLEYVARVKVPPSLPRYVPLDAPAGQRHFVLLEDLIAEHAQALFPGMNIVDAYRFRVTRDADLDLQEDEADDLLQAIESELRKRRFGEPVRLECESRTPASVREMLRDALGLTDLDCYGVDGMMMGLGELASIAFLDEPSLHDRPFTPSIPKRLRGATDIFAVIREGDLLLHHPYESFDPVVQFVRQAAEDPDVLAIKQTLYRTSGNSPVVAALIDAAENGKQVATLIELKARFDEQNNILWARNLERVGAHVVYGLSGLKTHAKVTLVVRNEPDGIRRYMHFGTGNYNEKTARIYTDMSLFTALPTLGADATQLFNALTGFSKAETYQHLLVAPMRLRAGLTALIDRETEHAKAGRPSGIVAKLNAITDAGIAQALYRASQAGVPIDLIVRGICVVRPGVPGVSETIRVRSIVGRFLEHSRITQFANGGAREVYIGSADWMGRNLDRRVETVIPVLDPAIRDVLCDEILAAYRSDNLRARELLSDGTYVRRIVQPGELPVDVQQTFMRRYLAG